jgi:hypothetical protein
MNIFLDASQSQMSLFSKQVNRRRRRRRRRGGRTRRRRREEQEEEEEKKKKKKKKRIRRGRAKLEDPGVDGRIILKWIFERLDGRTDWISLAQDRNRWQALVKAVMNLRVP